MAKIFFWLVKVEEFMKKFKIAVEWRKTQVLSCGSNGGLIRWPYKFVNGNQLVLTFKI